MLKTYANLLQALFGRRCFLLRELVDDVILPLQKFRPIASKLMAKTRTLASIIWAVFKQGCQFTLGQMEEDGDREAEWDTAVTMIRSKSDFSLLEVPMSISGVTTIAVATGRGKRKEREEEVKITPGDTPATEGSQLPKKTRPGRYTGQNLPVHKVIEAKLTNSLPDRFIMRKLTEACGIKDMSYIFPEEPNLCLHLALQGWCPFHAKCRLKHDPSLVTDKMAENVFNLFDPFIKNPKILSGGK